MTLNLANLLFVLLAAWIGGAAAARLGYPAVLGELLIGILLGPPILGLLDSGPALAVLAEIGILLMMIRLRAEAVRLAGHPCAARVRCTPLFQRPVKFDGHRPLARACVDCSTVDEPRRLVHCLRMHRSSPRQPECL